MPSPNLKCTLRTPQVHQPFPRFVEQRFHALDAEDFAGEFGEDRGLVAAAGAQFQHAMIGMDVEPLGHQRDDVRLTDRLAEADGGSAVGEGFVPRVSLMKKRSRGTARMAWITRGWVMPRSITWRWIITSCGVCCVN